MPRKKITKKLVKKTATFHPVTREIKAAWVRNAALEMLTACAAIGESNTERRDLAFAAVDQASKVWELTQGMMAGQTEPDD